ncbi:MAG: aldo/keto reductase [Candidatus Asgardarchaeum californiense]|nr:MAG: aldo/keto reductase [Candidatus Asgardarchaeum californiense]
MIDLKPLGNTQEKIPAIGMGTWRMGGGMAPDYSRDNEEIAALKHGLELGMWLIDTAEIYGGGHAEELVAEAIKGYPRDDVFIVTKVWSTHLHYDDVIKAAKGSLKRLRLKYVDLYLIHWPSHAVPLSETMKAMEKLVEMGLVRYIGVSNFNVSEMEEARNALSKNDIVVNQVKYNLLDRSIERDVLPYCQREKITIMAYTPLAKGELARNPILKEIGKKYGKTAAQVALNWLISKDHVMAIPKASSLNHVEENAGAMGWRLSPDDVKFLNEKFK